MKIFILIILLLTINAAHSQCTYNDKVVIGGDFMSFDFNARCPTYNFSFDGDSSRTWNILNDPIDIKQVPFLIDIKTRLESKIKEYSGIDFLSHLEFYSSEITYMDSISKFSDRVPTVDTKNCKAKYFFYYYLIPTDGVKHCIGIALNDKEEIISKYNFPSQNDYKQIDTTLTICDVVEIAKQAKIEIEPIEKISFEYDEASKQYYWEIDQEILKKVEGQNEFNRILVNASNRTVIGTKGNYLIQFHKRYKTHGRYRR